MNIEINIHLRGGWVGSSEVKKNKKIKINFRTMRNKEGKMFKVKKGFTVIKASILIAVIAILIVLVGVWYVSKNRAGADVVKTGAGGTTSQNTIPSNIKMWKLSGLVKGTDGKPIANTMVIFRPKTCKEKSKWLGKKPKYSNGNYGGVYYSGTTHENGRYLISAMPPGFYCGDALGGNGPGTGLSFNTDAEVRSDGIETEVNFNLSPIDEVLN